MSVSARARLFSRRASAAERYQAKRVGRDQLQRPVDLRRGRRRHRSGATQSAGAVEMDLAAQGIGEVRRGERGVERLQRAGRIAGGEPGIAGLDPEIGAARILRALAPRARPARRRSRPAASARARRERGRGTCGHGLRRLRCARHWPWRPRPRHWRASGRCRRGSGSRRPGPRDRRAARGAGAGAGRGGGIGSGEDGKVGAACRASASENGSQATPSAWTRWRSAARDPARATAGGRRP